MVDACPNCESTLRAIDGAYNIVDGVTEFIGGPEQSVAEFRELLRILRDAREKNLANEEIESEIQRSAPSFSGLLEWLPEDPNLRIAILTFFITTIYYAVNLYLKQKKVEQAEQHHNESVEIKEQHHKDILEDAAKKAENVKEEEVRDMIREILNDMKSDGSEKDSEN